MNFATSAYNNLLLGLASGTFTSSTTIDAALMKNTYVFDKTHSLISNSVFSTNELTGGSYSRYTGSTFTVGAVSDEVQYTALSPSVTFTAFTGTWRYVVFFDHSTSKVLLCFDALDTYTNTATALTVSNGAIPWITISAQ